jgi:hypothetical protein
MSDANDATGCEHSHQLANGMKTAFLASGWNFSYADNWNLILNDIASAYPAGMVDLPSLGLVMRSLSSCLDATRMWPSTERASLEKKPSTRLSQAKAKDLATKHLARRAASTTTKKLVHRF